MPDRTPILPPLRRTATDAEAFARVVHAGQVDKAGRPYVEHLQRVAFKTYVDWPVGVEGRLEGTQVAWLHDTIEDTSTTLEGLRSEGFSDFVAAQVGMLTRRGWSGSYHSYIESFIASRPTFTALFVKLADMEDNADPERLALLPDDVRARLERKYGPALEMLRAAVERGAGR